MQKVSFLHCIADQTTYVIKQVNIKSMKKEERENTVKEVQILASLDHPSIIRYYDSFIDKPTRTLNIVMEYAPKGTLFDVIENRSGQKFPESTIWKYFIQCLYGLNCMNSFDLLKVTNR